VLRTIVMRAKGIIKLKVSGEEVKFTTDCSREAFIDLTRIFNGVPVSYCFIKGMYFDEELTEKELKILTEN
jgi:hypothetical protein